MGGVSGGNCTGECYAASSTWQVRRKKNRGILAKPRFAFIRSGRAAPRLLFLIFGGPSPEFGSIAFSSSSSAGSLAIATHGLHPNTGVSTDISVSFVSAAAENETLDITAECVRLGRTLAFTDVVVRAAAGAGTGGEGRLVGMGKHTKFVAKAHEEAGAAGG
ncbi:MAG: hypothetical protein BJ554DRAFT_6427 [Olpidium bornovanus]|uniref:Thioesterase domain-containing protein n=1 Tax=Olpidium bornovanus TaxID=278681 RepID=A0A8H7ZYL9_9FUNG|nr:MAG: hypothetical protein BJ554DRAFT_6427 [Olpidium bornovanus]